MVRTSARPPPNTPFAQSAMTDLRTGSADRRVSGVSREPRPAGVRLTTLQRIAATAGIAGIVLLLGVLTFDGIRSAREARDSVAETHRVIETAQETLQDLINAETGQRGFLLTNDDRYLAPYRAALLALRSDTSILRRLTGSDPQQREKLDTLSERIGNKFAELAETIRLERLGKYDSALAVVRSDSGQNTMDDIRAKLRDLSSRQRALLAERTAAADNHFRLVEAIVIGGTAAAVIISLLLNTLLTRFADVQA